MRASRWTAILVLSWGAFWGTQGGGNTAIEESAPTISEALNTLLGSNSGRKLIQKTLGQWEMSEPAEILGLLKWGSSSRTDAVLTRHYNPKTGEEHRERRITIYLREGQSKAELALDIAHELVHATARPAWDPYDPKLTPGKYILAAIEGEGGEVDAVFEECRISMELAGESNLPSSRCVSYLTREKDRERIEKEKVRKDFYRVGKWKNELEKKLGDERSLFALLTADSVKLYSSTGHAPYPVALFREFEEITRIACENSKKRAATLTTRKPAAASTVVAFLAQRCEGMSIAPLPSAESNPRR